MCPARFARDFGERSSVRRAYQSLQGQVIRPKARLTVFSRNARASQEHARAEYDNRAIVNQPYKAIRHGVADPFASSVGCQDRRRTCRTAPTMRQGRRPAAQRSKPQRDFKFIFRNDDFRGSSRLRSLHDRVSRGDFAKPGTPAPQGGNRPCVPLPLRSTSRCPRSLSA